MKLILNNLIRGIIVYVLCLQIQNFGNAHVDETKLKQQLIYFYMHFYLQFVFDMDMFF